MAFFPCIYFCQNSQILMYYNNLNYRTLTPKGKIDKILERADSRNYFYKLLNKLFGIAMIRGIRLIVENPWTPPLFLENNFLFPPTIIDKNRMLRGDYYTKPTAYWFVNCKNENGFTLQMDKKRKVIYEGKGGVAAGICSEERSMISPDYARNFICDFILGRKQPEIDPQLF